jgi:hypothetical protein
MGCATPGASGRRQFIALSIAKNDKKSIKKFPKFFINSLQCKNKEVLC